MKRRDILRAGASSIAFAGMWSAATPAAAAAATDFAWNRAAALALVGQPFWLNHPELRAIGLTLDAVLTPDHVAADPRLEQFSLSFSSAGIRFAAGTYEMEHAAIGRFMLYVAPTGTSAAPRYRADFSLMG